MPGMDGYEVAQHVRRLPDCADALLIALSGYREDRATLDEAGFDGYFVKPVDFRSLVARVGTHLAAR